jgi:hypothetical protein
MQSMTLLDLTRMLTREASIQGCAVYGVLVDPREDAKQPFILFLNVSERGEMLAKLLRETADLIDKRAKAGLITAEMAMVRDN